MSVKIRLQRHGSKKRPFYFIVVANSTAPRDGKFIEKLGTYNPLSVPATVRLSRERSLHWMQNGAQPTNTCRRILSFKGVLFLKHLMRGVGLGLFDEATAWEKFEKWNGEHEEVVARRQEAHRKHKTDKRNAIVSESVKRVEEKNAVRAAELQAVADEEAAVARAAEQEAAAAAAAEAGEQPEAAVEETTPEPEANVDETTEAPVADVAADVVVNEAPATPVDNPTDVAAEPVSAPDDETASEEKA